MQDSCRGIDTLDLAGQLTLSRSLIVELRFQHEHLVAGQPDCDPANIEKAKLISYFLDKLLILIQLQITGMEVFPSVADYLKTLANGAAQSLAGPEFEAAVLRATPNIR